MENVPEVIGANNVQHFIKWTNKLESLGYSNYFQIMNGKDYGIPQNRRRCFMVSILGEFAYDFPLKHKLKYKLKDFLEKQVDEKYYLSDKLIEFFTYNTEKQKSSGNGFKRKTVSATDGSKVAKTVTTRNGSRMDDNFIDETRKVGNYGNGHHAKDVFDSNGCSPTITTGNHGLGQAIVDKKVTGGGLPIMENTKQGYKIAKPGDGVNLASRMHHQRGNVQKESIQTIKTQMEIGVVVDDERK